MKLAYIINEKSLTVILEGKGISVPSSHQNFEKIKAALISGDHDGIPNLLNVRKAIEAMGGGDIQIVGDKVVFQGRDVPNYLATKIISMNRQGYKDILPVKNYTRRLMGNISFRSREEFPRFMDSQEFPMDADGFVYAWRGLLDNYYSVNGNLSTRVLKGKVNAKGQIYNGVGEEIEVERADVDDNCNRTCSYGVHVGSFAYAREWSRGRVVLVKFDPKDVVSVPTDCGGQKCRICHYWVVSDYVAEKPIEEAVYSDKKPAAKTDEKNYNRGHYYAKFCAVARKVEPKDGDFGTVKVMMNDAGFTDDSIIQDLFTKYLLSRKINKYLDNKDGLATMKQIQSRMKAEKLSQAEIEDILNKFGGI